MAAPGLAIRIARAARSTLPVTVLCLLLGHASGVLADEDTDKGSGGSPLDSKFLFAVGGFFPSISSTFTVTPPNGSGGEISAEDDLGLDSSTASAWIGFSWRFQPRHQVQVEWFQLNRDGESSTTRSFSPNQNVTIGVGAATSSKVDINLGRVTYGYSILRTEDWDGAFLAGLHVATFKATLTASGNVTVNGMPLVGGSYSDSTSTHTIPLPHIGGSIRYRINPQWSASATALLFALEIDNYGGSLFEVDANVAYAITRNFGLGAGLKYFNFNLKANSDRSGGASFDFTFFGPAVFGYATF